jgi:hypothetical protein
VQRWIAVAHAEGKFKTPAPARTPRGETAEKSGSKNPFTAANWNVTEQGRLVKVNPKMAASLAEAAGVKIGATRPAVNA